MPVTKSNSSVLEQAERQRQVLHTDKSSYSEKQFRKDYKEGAVVGQGVWGVVSDVCLKGKREEHRCDALKRVMITRTVDFQTADLDYQYLTLLRSLRLSGFPIVPQVKHMWISESKRSHSKSHYNLLMSKYDGNMHYLCVDLRAHHLSGAYETDWKRLRSNFTRPQGIYYRSELLRMYQIAWMIGQKGVVHGDLKPDQYLFNYRHTENTPVKDIALTDFGFAGLVSDVRRAKNKQVATAAPLLVRDGKFPIQAKKFGLPEMGWPSNEKSPNAFGVLPSGLIRLQSRREASCMNIAQLEAFLISDGVRIPTLVIDDRLPSDKRQLLVFAGVRRITTILKRARRLREWFTSDFFETYQDCTRQWKKNSKTIYFSVQDIQRPLL